MNVDNGHLVRLVAAGDGRNIVSELEEIAKLNKEAYKEVPDELAAEAERELGDKNETYVDLTKDSPLAGWAAKKRLEQQKKKKAKRKVAKESRKKNR